MPGRKVTRQAHPRRTKDGYTQVSEHLLTVSARIGRAGGKVVLKGGKKAATLLGEKTRSYLKRRKIKKARLREGRKRVGPRKFRGKGASLKPRKPFPHKGRTL